MKKLLAFLLGFSLVLSLCACAKQDAPEPTGSSTLPSSNGVCEHLMLVQYRIEPTCAQEGRTFAVCEYCAEESLEIIPSLPHSFSEAGCTTAKTCSACGIVEGDPLGHNYVSGSCERCGAEMPNYEEQPTGCDHAYRLTAQSAPTCTAVGSFTYTCGKCNATYTETIAAKGHVFSDATCDQAKTCHICDTTEGNALGHNYLDGTCGRCGAPDPSVPTEATYTVTVRSDKGKLISGVTVNVYTEDNALVASAVTNSKGVATIKLVSAQRYQIVLSNVPDGYSAKKSYTITSTRVNINLTTLPQISPEDHSKANYKAGSIMGDFTLTDTDGNSYTLSMLLQEKKLVILNFWFVNCGPCKAEFPYFEAVYQKYAQDVQLLTLNHLDTEAQIEQLREQMGVTFPMIHENIGMQAGFDIIAYPTTVFIDETGKILRIKVGDFTSQTELEALIKNYLK